MLPHSETATGALPLGSFVERAHDAPGAPALVCGEGHIGYDELYGMTLEATAHLRELGVREGERVAVWGAKSPQAIALVLACLLSGRPILIPPADIRRDALRRLLRRAGIRQLLVPQPAQGPTMPAPARAPVAEPARGEPHGPADAGPQIAPDVALMLTTSGSTGFPKVVPLSHAAIERFASWAGARFDIHTGTQVLSYCGLSFDLSILEVWTTLMRGGCVVLAPPARLTNGAHLLELIRRHEVEVIQGVPMLHGLLIEAAAASRHALRGVKHAILTGDSTPVSYLERLRGLFEVARLYNVYGCTETNDSFIHEIDVAHSVRAGAIPIGEPLPAVSARIVCDGELVEAEGSGELWVSTPFQAGGYLGTRSPQFVADPRGESERVYFRTGDLVRRDRAGAIFLRGRSDLQVKIRGIRVDVQRVEQAMLAHPAILEAATVALEEPLAGRRLHAVVRRRAGANLSSLRLREHCARLLAPAAIPSAIEVVDRPLPKTSTGKVDREIVKRALEGERNGHGLSRQAVHRQ
jgi:acyl-coenzyme A synthetase/AMP-(fatty) acid ligase